MEQKPVKRIILTEDQFNTILNERSLPPGSGMILGCFGGVLFFGGVAIGFILHMLVG